MREPTAGEVELAVRAVLAELVPFGPIAGGSTESGTLVFPGKLLALREAGTFSSHVRSVRIVPGTVVTPMARDLLKQRGISISWGSQVASTRRGVWGFAIESPSGQTEALQRSLLTNLEPWQDLGHSAVAGARWASECRDRGVLVLSASGALACWQANLVRGTRAAIAHDPSSLQRAIEGIGPNLVVLEPHDLTLSQMTQLAQIFQRHGAPRAPHSVSLFDQEYSHANWRSDRTGHTFPAPPQPPTWAVAHYPAVATRGTSLGFNATG